MAAGDWAAWSGAAATILLFLVGGMQIDIERRARKKTEREGQANRVSGWLRASGGRNEPGVLLNASNEPVYQVVVWLVLIQGAGPARGEDVHTYSPTAVSVLPPGSYFIDLDGLSGVMHGRPGVEVGFTDARGLHWIRRSGGAVEQITRSAPDHYALTAPLDWIIPTPA